MFHILGCPMHFGVGVEGLSHSVYYLENYCKDLKFDILPELVAKEEEERANLKTINSVIANCNQIAKCGYSILKEGKTPIYIAGDHSSAMGSVSASSEYFHDTYNEEIGLIWFDAHPDINTDKTTVTGNIHGMPVAALLGLGEKRLTEFLSDRPKVKAENIVMIGLRDIDPPEAVILKENNILYFTYQDVLDKGLQTCLDEAIAHLSHLKHVHLSFDIDATDPSVFPGVSVPVKSGFHEEDAVTVFHEFIHRLPICSYDIVEFNTDFDVNDKTAAFAEKMIHCILDNA